MRPETEPLEQRNAIEAPQLNSEVKEISPSKNITLTLPEKSNPKSSENLPTSSHTFVIQKDNRIELRLKAWDEIAKECTAQEKLSEFFPATVIDLLEEGNSLICSEVLSFCEAWAKTGRMLSQELLCAALSYVLAHKEDKIAFNKTVELLYYSLKQESMSGRSLKPPINAIPFLSQALEQQQTRLRASGALLILCQYNEVPLAVLEQLASLMVQNKLTLLLRQCCFQAICMAATHVEQGQKLSDNILSSLYPIFKGELLNEFPHARAEVAKVFVYHAKKPEQISLAILYLEQTIQEEQCSAESIDALLYRLNQGKHYLSDQCLTNLMLLMTKTLCSVENKIKVLELIAHSAKNRGEALPEAMLLNLETLLQQEQSPALSQAYCLVLSNHIKNLHYFTLPSYKTIQYLIFIQHHPELKDSAQSVLRMMVTRAKDVSLSKEEQNLMEQINQALLKPQESTSTNEANLSKSTVSFEGNKSLEVLLSELIDLNQENPNVSVCFSDDSLRQRLTEITTVFHQDSSVSPASKPISEWSEEDCKVWAFWVKEHPDQAKKPLFLAEIIAVIDRANELVRGFRAHEIQLLSLLLLLDGKDKGRLAEIATGEGKSVSVAMLAVVKTLQGHTVDIVTSSPVLACEASNQQKTFFELFNFTVDHNCDETADSKSSGDKSKSCYQANIVYGTANSFEWDLLNQESQGEKTRLDRPYDVVIVDEVDSLLLDEASAVAKLAGHKAYFEKLELLLASCNRQLAILTGGLSQKGEQFFWQIDAKSEPIKVSNPKSFLRPLLEEYLIGLITKKDSNLSIPPHLKTFALKQVAHWVNGALAAQFDYKLGKDYIITKDKVHGHEIVSPIDYQNTGSIQANCVWSHGIHQFLQMKHGLKVTSESLMTCYISNLSFFRRYDKNIYGLSGTLGTDREKRLLADAYHLDWVHIPTYKPKHHTEIPGVLAQDGQEWLDKIANSVAHETGQRRAVLVIAETLNAVDEIHQRLLAQGIQERQIKHFTRNDNEESLAIATPVKAGDVIIATNIAGRGTNIKTSKEVEEAGGVHVCLTLMPRNIRVEQQAIGRTSRQGNAGSSQLIVNKEDTQAWNLSEDKELDLTTLDELKAYRNELEEVRLSTVEKVKIPKLELQDELFAKYCSLRQELCAIANNSYRLKAVEELWGFFITQIMNQLEEAPQIERTAVLEQFSAFQEQARQMFLLKESQNPALFIQEANHLSHHYIDQQKALELYDKALERDPENPFALYERARTKILLKDKVGAVADLKQAKEKIRNGEIPHIEALSVVVGLTPGVSAQASQPDSALNQQVQKKVRVLKTLENNVGDLISFIERSERDLLVHPQALQSLFNSSSNLDNDLHELFEAGLSSFFTLEEEVEEDDFSLFDVLCCAFLGAIQVIIGVALYSTGNIYLGSALISQGIGDIITAAQALIDQRFSWDTYGQAKLTSIVIEVITMGSEALLQRANTAKRAMANRAENAVAREAVKKQSIQQFTKAELLAQAKKKVCDALVTSGIQTIAGYAFDHLSQTAVKHFEGDIRTTIEKEFLNEMRDESVKEALDKLLITDALNQNHEQLHKISALTRSLFTQKQDRFRNFTSTVIRGVARRKSEALGPLITLYDVADGISQVQQITSQFSEEFRRQILFIAHCLPEPKEKAHYDSATKRDEIHYQMVFKPIIEGLTQSMVATLHGKVARPIVNEVMQIYVQKLTANVVKRVDEWRSQPIIPVTEAIAEKNNSTINTKKKVHSLQGNPVKTRSHEKAGLENICRFVPANKKSQEAYDGAWLNSFLLPMSLEAQRHHFNLMLPNASVFTQSAIMDAKTFVSKLECQKNQLNFFSDSSYRYQVDNLLNPIKLQIDFAETHQRLRGLQPPCLGSIPRPEEQGFYFHGIQQMSLFDVLQGKVWEAGYHISTQDDFECGFHKVRYNNLIDEIQSEESGALVNALRSKRIGDLIQDIEKQIRATCPVYVPAKQEESTAPLPLILQEAILASKLPAHISLSFFAKRTAKESIEPPLLSYEDTFPHSL